MSDQKNTKTYQYVITTDYDLVIINGKEYSAPKEVCQLIEFISKERDNYKDQIKNAILNN